MWLFAVVVLLRQSVVCLSHQCIAPQPLNYSINLFAETLILVYLLENLVKFLQRDVTQSAVMPQYVVRPSVSL